MKMTLYRIDAGVCFSDVVGSLGARILIEKAVLCGVRIRRYRRLMKEAVVLHKCRGRRSSFQYARHLRRSCSHNRFTMAGFVALWTKVGSAIM
jgi:hypothetical protein